MAREGLEETVKRNVRAVRLAAGLSQKDFAKKSGLSIRYISRLETQGGNVTLEVLERIAKGLGCSVESLVAEGKLRAAESEADAIEEAIQILKGVRSRF